MGKRRKMTDVQKIRLALDDIAAEIAAEGKTPDYSIRFGGELHQRFINWWDANPGLDNKESRTFAEIRNWDEAKKPQIAKSIGQGILGFYIHDGHLPCDVDDPGKRIPFKDCGPSQWDGWWEIEKKNMQKQLNSMRGKEDIYLQVRWAWRGPTDRMEKLVREVFGWNEDMDLDEGQDEAAD